MRIVSTLLVALSLVACGGGTDPVPLIEGQISGSYNGDEFTPVHGFAAVYMERDIIGLGDGNLHCDSPDSNVPPDGTNAILVMPSLELTTHFNVEIHMYQNIDEFSGFGTSEATVTLTSVTEESIAGSVDYDYTSTEGETYSLSGTFEVSRCSD